MAGGLCGAGARQGRMPREEAQHLALPTASATSIFLPLATHIAALARSTGKEAAGRQSSGGRVEPVGSIAEGSGTLGSRKAPWGPVTLLRVTGSQGSPSEDQIHCFS